MIEHLVLGQLSPYKLNLLPRYLVAKSKTFYTIAHSLRSQSVKMELA